METMEINNTTSQMDLSDVQRMFHQIATEYSSGIHAIFSRIDHTFNHTHTQKKPLKIFKKVHVISSIFQPQ